MKIILVLFLIGTLGMADSQWRQYKNECQKSGGKAYKVKNNKFECKMHKQAKYMKNQKTIQKKKIKGPEFKDGITAMISASF